MAGRLTEKVFILILCFCSLVVINQAQENVQTFTPAKYFALVGGTARLPCMSSSSRSTLTWSTKKEDSSLKSRSRTEVDPVNSTITFRIIEKVQPSDSGQYVCSNGRINSTLQLYVVNPSEPLEVTAELIKMDEALIKWKPPARSPNVVRGYRIFVTDVSRSNQTKEFEDNRTKAKNAGEFLLEDVLPNRQYDIEVAAMYMDGALEFPSTYYGPKSTKFRLDTTNKVSSTPGVPQNVEAKSGANNSIIVTWQPPTLDASSDTFNYKVFYEGQTKNNKKSGEVLVTSPNEENTWETVLEGLPIKTKYKIEVATVLMGPSPVTGPKSKPLLYSHDGFTPEMSLNAVPLAPDTVLVTLDSVGDAVIDALRVLYSDDTAIDWIRIEDFDQKKRYAIVRGLKPNSHYYFMAKARVSLRPRQTVTHAFTPPIGMSAPTNVTVAAEADRNVLLTWSNPGSDRPKGYIVHVLKVVGHDQTEPHKQVAVVEQTEVVITDLLPNQQYEVQVVPFNYQNRGLCSAPTRFQLPLHPLDVSTKDPVYQPPIFRDTFPEELIVKAGDKLQLTCEADGVPTPELQWFIDGNPVGYKAEGSNDLTIKSVEQTMQLVCVARNSVRSAQKKTRVIPERSPQVNEPPRFRETFPEDIYIKEGEDLKLICEADGVPLPELQWYKDGEPFVNIEEGRNDLTIMSVQQFMELTCIARNSVKSARKRVFVNVIPRNMKPVFTGGEEEFLNVPKYSDVKLNCAATGIPPPTVRWYHNNRSVSVEAKERVEYLVRRVTVPLQLQCRAVNSEGSSTKKLFILVRADPAGNQRPFLLDSLPEKVEVVKGEDVSLTCHAWGEPMPRVVWYRNNKLAHTEILGDGRLKFSENNVMESFQLRCRAKNLHGDEIRSVDVLVKEPPKSPVLVSRLPKTFEKNYGESLTIPCEFHGDPTPTVTWYNDSQPLTDSSPSSQTLYIRHVSESMLLRCRAVNEAGMGEIMVTVNVRYTYPTTRATPATKTATTTATTYRPRPTIDSSYTVRVMSEMKAPGLLEIRWIVDKGQLNDIGLFKVSVYLEGEFVMNEEIGSNTRILNLKSVIPGRRYMVMVETLGKHNSLLSHSYVETLAQEYIKPKTPSLRLELTEIRDTSFKYKLIPSGLDPTKYNYRIVLDEISQERGTRNWKNEIFTELPSLGLVEATKPLQKFKILAELLTKRNSLVMNISHEFETANTGSYRPAMVLVSIPERVTSAPITTTTTTSTTVDLTTETSTTATTTASMLDTTTVTDEIVETTNLNDILTETSSTPSVTTDITTEEPFDETYVVSSRTRLKSPNNVVFTWQVDQGNLDAIKKFKVFLFDAKGRQKLESEVAGNQRYINIHPLPNGNYTLLVKAMGDDGELFQHNISSIVSPAAMDSEPKVPRLELEANEIRSNNVNIVWDVFNTTPNAVQSYRVQVFEGGPDGFNLMNKTMGANAGTLRITNLYPKTRYHVIVDAIGTDGNQNMTSSVTFETPSLNGYGKSVKGVMDPIINSDEPESVPEPEPEPDQPQLDMTISKSDKVGQSGSLFHNIKWSVKNVPDNKIDQFLLKLRSDGPSGDLQINENFGPSVILYELEGMQPQSLYYLELEALTADNMTYISVQTFYTPNVSPDPYKVSNTTFLPTLETILETTAAIPDSNEPRLEIIISQDISSYGVKTSIPHDIIWAVKNVPEDKINGYRLKIFDNLSGAVLLNESLSSFDYYYPKVRMQYHRLYYLELEALTDVNLPYISVQTFYTPGKSTDPHRVSNTTFVPTIETTPVTTDATLGHSLSVSTLPTVNNETITVENDSKSEPLELQLDLQSVQSDGTLMMTWMVKNENAANPISTFEVSVLEYNEGGAEVLKEIVDGDIRNFTALDLEQNGQYYFTVVAQDSEGNELAQDSKVLERDLSSEESTDLPTEPEDQEFYIDLMIQHIDKSYNPTLTWKVGINETAHLVNKYELNVYRHDLNGQLLLKTDLKPHEQSYTLTGLGEVDSVFFIVVEARDVDDKLLARVQSDYRSPERGDEFDAIMVSSRSTTPEPINPDDNNLIITEIAAVSSTSIFLQWFDRSAPGGKTTTGTALRFSETDSSSGGNFAKLEFKAGEIRATINNLKPNTTYGFQVAPLRQGIPMDDWSQAKIIKTLIIESF